MLRFDLPRVDANAVRIDAIFTTIVSAFALLGIPYLIPLLAIQGFVRGFFRHGLEPLHRVSTGLLKSWGRSGKAEDAGAKMFANKILFIAATIATVLWSLSIPMWKVPVTALLIFSAMEWGFKFCAGCWAYSLYYQIRQPKS